MKIFWIKAQAPLRVLALAKHLQLDFQDVHLDLEKGELKSPEYAKLNPNLKAPTLVDGQLVLWESLAIMVYLANKADSDLWPTANFAEQIEILKWTSWSSSHWDSAVAPYYFEHIVKPTLAGLPPDRNELEGKFESLLRWAQVLNNNLEGKHFVTCDRLTIADFYMASMARYWMKSEMPLAEFTHITDWLKRLEDFPAWRDPWPDAKDR
jgi:glutathione S-transferase